MSLRAVSGAAEVGTGVEVPERAFAAPGVGGCEGACGGPEGCAVGGGGNPPRADGGGGVVVLACPGGIGGRPDDGGTGGQLKPCGGVAIYA